MHAAHSRNVLARHVCVWMTAGSSRRAYGAEQPGTILSLRASAGSGLLCYGMRCHAMHKGPAVCRRRVGQSGRPGPADPWRPCTPAESRPATVHRGPVTRALGLWILEAGGRSQAPPQPPDRPMATHTQGRTGPPTAVAAKTRAQHAHGVIPHACGAHAVFHDHARTTATREHVTSGVQRWTRPTTLLCTQRLAARPECCRCGRRGVRP